MNEKKKMCPLMEKSCDANCAWFMEGDCAMEMLHYIENRIDSVQDSLNDLVDTIDKIDFN